MAQTAVEWFFEVLAHNDIIDHKGLCDDENLYNLLYILKNKAKQMEKDQITNAHLTGLIHPLEIEATKQAEQYYNETFGNK